MIDEPMLEYLNDCTTAELIEIAKVIQENVGYDVIYIAEDLYEQQKLEILVRWMQKMNLEEIQSIDEIVKSRELNKSLL